MVFHALQRTPGSPPRLSPPAPRWTDQPTFAASKMIRSGVGRLVTVTSSLMRASLARPGRDRTGHQRCRHRRTSVTPSIPCRRQNVGAAETSAHRFLRHGSRRTFQHWCQRRSDRCFAFPWIRHRQCALPVITAETDMLHLLQSLLPAQFSLKFETPARSSAVRIQSPDVEMSLPHRCVIVVPGDFSTESTTPTAISACRARCADHRVLVGPTT